MKSWWRTQRPASPLLLIAHPRCAGCPHSHCGNCGTGLSSLAGSWGVRREREDRGMAARPGARGCWWVEAVPECPAQSLRRWIPRLNWVMPCLIGEKTEAEREWLSTILLFMNKKSHTCGKALLTRWGKRPYFDRGPRRYSSTARRRWSCWRCVSGSRVSADCWRTFSHPAGPWILLLWSKASRPRQHLTQRKTHTNRHEVCFSNVLSRC